METIKSLGLTDHSRVRFESRYLDSVSWSVKRERLDNGLQALFQAFALAVPLSLICLGLVLFEAGDISMGQLLAAGTLAGTAIGPVMSISSSLQGLQVAGVHADRLRDIADEAVEEVGGEQAIEFTGAVELQDGVIGYPGEEPVLRGVDLRLRAGETVAVVGPSGAGKSTLARALMGLLPLQSGTLSFGGVSLDDVDISSVRARCGLVAQGSTGISGSLRENVAFGRDEVTSEVAELACRRAGLGDLVDSLPMGMETSLGEGGRGLSGG